MADDDGGSSTATAQNWIDPIGDVPPGGAYTIGGIGANDPLVDWASNLRKDDLANLVQNMDGHAQNLAAAGIPPPDTNALHAANGAAGTPTDPFRFDQSAEGSSPFNPDTYMGGMQPQKTGGLRMEVSPDSGPIPSTNQPESAPPKIPKPPVRSYNPADNPPSSPEAAGGPAGVGQPKGPLAPIGEAYQQGKFDPRVVKGKIAGMGEKVIPDAGPADAGSSPPPPTRYVPQERAGGGYGTTPAVTQPKVAPQQQAQPQQDTDKPPGADLNPKEDKGDKKKTKLEETGDAISDLGKALKGVVAPEPLKPPSSFAPAPHQAAAQRADVPSILAALASARGGQVPASVMPVLRVLGRA